MSEAQRESFIMKNVNLETHRKLTIQNGRSASPALPDVWSTECTEEVLPGLRQTVNVCGVILQVYERKFQVTTITMNLLLVLLDFLFPE